MSKQFDKEKRRKIFEEIIDTEEKYLYSLELLNKNYIVPLKKNKYLKFGRELNTIVSNLTVIVNFNNHLLTKLKNASEDDIGKTFQMIVPFLKTYTQYFSNYEAALNSIREADKNPKNKKFSEWLKKTDERSKEANQQTFKQLLIQPVQRIPRYNLLLSEVLKNTPRTHVDYDNLKLASEKMKEVADHLNRQITEIENRNKLIKLKEIFVLNQSGKGSGITNIVEPHRKYVFEGELSILSDNALNKQKHYFFLFSDMLVCCNEVPEAIKRKLIEDKFKPQPTKEKKRLTLFRNGEDNTNIERSTGAFDDDDNEIPEHFYTITFTIKFNTEKLILSSPTPTPTSSPLMSTASSPSTPSDSVVEDIWVRDFTSFESERFNIPTLFQLITSKETYTFETNDTKSREKWVSHLNSTLEELRKKKKDTGKDQAKPKGYPIVLLNLAALYVQAIARSKLTRTKKGDVENRFKPRKKTQKPVTSPMDQSPTTQPFNEPISSTSSSNPSSSTSMEQQENSPRPVRLQFVKPISEVTTTTTTSSSSSSSSSLTSPRKEQPTSTITITTLNDSVSSQVVATPQLVEEPQVTATYDSTTTTTTGTTAQPKTPRDEQKPITPRDQAVVVVVEDRNPHVEPKATTPRDKIATSPRDQVATTPRDKMVETSALPEKVEPNIVVETVDEDVKEISMEIPSTTSVSTLSQKHVTQSMDDAENQNGWDSTPVKNDNKDKTTPERSSSLTSPRYQSPRQSPRLYIEDEAAMEEEEVYYDEEGNVLPPWKVELMKKFKKYGRFNNVLNQSQQENKRVEKKIDIPTKGMQLSAIRSMFEQKDKQAQEEMNTLRRSTVSKY
ncbi:hypothetical protein C9374_014594 [Naegleria lovaniensis]|uniref:RhoGEF domain-containing protein n=1 Tax=Naegleria lovaniensis TaxID=51637 RepID=A0AA88H0T3_NAELO|nr:uncharacterized protein C9374_014594 [Naegleria lovaniensis]KAG2389194.1 hypothetical protein C9374_014594 [Naegleria lovaniensis]